MTFRHLEAFLAVAEAGGVTEASKRLHLTQPTVSGQIKELEDSLGLELFHRLPRGVALSSAGKTFLPLARKLIDDREAMFQEAARFRGLLSGELSFYASNIPGEYHIPRVLGRFRAAHPNVVVTCHISDSARAREKVLSGEAPFAIVGATGDGQGLTFTPLWDDELALYAADDAPVGARVTRKELGELDLVMRQEGSGSRRWVEEAFSGRGDGGARLRTVAEVGSTTALLEAVRNGVGVGFCSRIAAKDLAAAGAIREVTLTDLAPILRRFQLATSERRRLSPAAEVFVSLLREDAGQA